MRVAAADFPGREWMVTNGLGGYAGGPLGGGVARRHDGLLVAALEAPWGRFILLDRLEEVLITTGCRRVPLTALAEEVRLDQGLPVWRFAGEGLELERRLVMPYGQNTTMIEYRLLSGPAVRLELEPWIHMRGNDGWLDTPLPTPQEVRHSGRRLEIRQGDKPPLRLRVDAAVLDLTLHEGTVAEHVYPIEEDRGYPSRFGLWSPGMLTMALGDQPVVVTASAEPWPVAETLSFSEAWAAEQRRRSRLVAQADPALRAEPAAGLVLAADAFLFTPTGRPALAARLAAEGERLTSVIAGYPWFMDWGRDTMISLEGLALVTGRADEARRVLGTFARYVKDGLIPDNIPDGGGEPVYHACDATLWFFHAVARYMALTGDKRTLAELLPVLSDILEHHRRGTRFNIHVDPADGLLTGGAPDVMLTWMDSATPRRGKPVEINALWYNALRLMEGWLKAAGNAEGSARAAAEADRCRDSFNRRFWNPATGFLFDVVDGEEGDDPACRCNQIFALSLPHPVLDQARWAAVVGVVEQRLLTPVGLRSLSSDAADYCPHYDGNCWERDKAYHRGTVWAWLIGPFIDAWLRVHPGEEKAARCFLDAFLPHINDFCIGTIAEVFDAAPPHLPRGCTAQAWSVAEWLRAWVKTAYTKSR